ncbi:MAG: diguanylate cyclase [Succinivibrio sp.]
MAARTAGTAAAALLMLLAAACPASEGQADAAAPTPGAEVRTESFMTDLNWNASIKESLQRAEKVNIGVINTAGTVDAKQRHPLEGYMREFLTEISRTTGWSYNFVPVSREDGLAMLKSGQIDLLGPILPSSRDLQTYAATTGDLCYNMLGLYSLASRQDINIYDASTFAKLKVGYVGISPNIGAELAHYRDSNGWTFELVPYPDYESLIAAMRSGEAGAIVDDGTHVVPFFSRRIDTITAVPSSLIALKERQMLTNTVSAAVFNISRANPKFVTWLVARYIDEAVLNATHYSEEQNKFIRRAQPLAALLPRSGEPFSFNEDGKYSGILIDILGALRIASGIKFEPENADGYVEVQAISKKRPTVTFNVLSDISSLPPSTLASAAVYNENFTLVAVSGRDLPRFPRITVPRYFHDLADYIIKTNPLWKVTSYSSERSCLRAVCEGEADAALLPRAYIREYSLLTDYPEPLTASHLDYQVPLRLFISGKDARMYRDTLDVAIRKINQDDLHHRELTYVKEDSSIKYFITRHAISAIAAILVVLSVAGTAAFTWRSNRAQKRQNDVLKAKNEELRRLLNETHDLRAARDSYRLEAVRDVLTGLLNKRGISYEVGRRLTSSRPAPKQVDAFFIIDMDLFKEINDTKGHQAGDLALQRAADVLRNVFNPEDAIGRFGGDEFVVFTQHVMNHQAIFHAASKIKVKIRGILSDQGVERVTASIGVAVRPDDGTDYESLFKVADESLYKVKQAGGNGVCASCGQVLNESVRFENGRHQRSSRQKQDGDPPGDEPPAA